MNFWRSFISRLFFKRKNNTEAKVNKYGKSIVFSIELSLQGACAEWTKEGWVCPGSLDLSCLELTELPLIKSVEGWFNCLGNKLTSLEGCPQNIKGWFNCSDNSLFSLKGGPVKVDGFYNCSDNQLFSLEGSPRSVSDFFCHNNRLFSLKGCPQEIKGNFNCIGNPESFTEEAIKAVCDVKGRISS